MHGRRVGLRVLRTIIKERFSGPVRSAAPMPAPIVVLPVAAAPVAVAIERDGETGSGWSDPAWVQNGSASTEALIAR